jgi:regulation of enolase protein 1 (concanavalin A-like superfamily)
MDEHIQLYLLENENKTNFWRHKFCGVIENLPLYKITLSEAFKLRRQSPFTLMSAVSQPESGPAKPAANR